MIKKTEVYAFIPSGGPVLVNRSMLSEPAHTLSLSQSWPSSLFLSDLLSFYYQTPFTACCTFLHHIFIFSCIFLVPFIANF